MFVLYSYLFVKIMHLFDILFCVSYQLHIILCCDTCTFALSVLVYLNIVMFESLDICHICVI